MQHRPAPNKRFVAGIQETNRNDLEAMNFERRNAIVATDLRLPAKAKHEGNVGAVYVSVQQSDSVSELCQDNCQIDGKRRLSHAALTRADSDDGIHAGQGLRPLWWLSRTWLHG